MLRLSLLLLALSACVCNAGVALFYGPVWDNNEFGFSLFDGAVAVASAPSGFTDMSTRAPGDGDAPEVTPLRGTGRLVNAPSFKGVLAGVRTSIVYGAFRWLGNEPAFGLAAVDMAKLTIAPIYPSVFGSSVRLAAWRNEDAGSFFVLGDFTGSQSDPYVKVKGIASCFVDSGCAALTTGFLSIPSDSHPASMVWSAKTQTLAVMYTSGDVSPTVMLCQWKPSAGWFFRDVTPQYHNAVNEAMVSVVAGWRSGAVIRHRDAFSRAGGARAGLAVDHHGRAVRVYRHAVWPGRPILRRATAIHVQRSGRHCQPVLDVFAADGQLLVAVSRHPRNSCVSWRGSRSGAAFEPV